MARILIIEDDQTLNEALVETLEDEGHQVASADSGKAALDLAKEHKFELAVSDVRLPGMNGIETLTALKAEDPSLKCIIITGYASADTPIDAIRLKVEDYLFKPFSLDYFLSSVNRALVREEEQKSKLNLIKKLSSLFAKYQDQALIELVAERQESFRGLYLGVRSGYLHLQAASEIYNKLELLEKEFRGILNAPVTDSKAARTLQLSYNALSNRIASLEVGADTDLSESIVPQNQMSALFQAMKSSEIGLDDLQYAPLLRETPDNRFETLQRLLAIKRRLWPSLSEAL